MEEELANQKKRVRFSTAMKTLFSSPPFIGFLLLCFFFMQAYSIIFALIPLYGEEVGLSKHHVSDDIISH